MSAVRAADYFGVVSSTDLMRVVVALSTEVYALTDRLRALEAALARSGVDLRTLDAPMQPAAFHVTRRAQRDGFVQRVFGALERPEAVPTAPGMRRAGAQRGAVQPVDAKRAVAKARKAAPRRAGARAAQRATARARSRR